MNLENDKILILDAWIFTTNPPRKQTVKETVELNNLLGPDGTGFLRPESQ